VEEALLGTAFNSKYSGRGAAWNCIHFKIQLKRRCLELRSVQHRVEEALLGTAFSSTFHFVLDFKTLSECGKIGGTEFKQSAVFVLKQLAYSPDVVLSDSGLLLLIRIL
jgi:hypothetical protein